MKRIAVFASGSGSNAENLALYFRNHPVARVTLLISNRKEAFALERMKRLGIPAYYIRKEDFSNGRLLEFLAKEQIDLIVLAGFLMLVPEGIINAFRGRMVNIHPALLPKYGGKGMFGMHVHEAVVKAGESKTGITVHYVNEHFDEGEIIARYETSVNPDDTPESVAKKVHELEMNYFPKVIEKLLLQPSHKIIP